MTTQTELTEFDREPTSSDDDDLITPQGNPACGAETAAGSPCLQPEIPGVGVCQRHLDRVLDD